MGRLGLLKNNVLNPSGLLKPKLKTLRILETEKVMCLHVNSCLLKPKLKTLRILGTEKVMFLCVNSLLLKRKLKPLRILGNPMVLGVLSMVDAPYAIRETDFQLWGRHREHF